MHRWLSALAGGFERLVGGDRWRVAQLRAGVSTEAEVRALFGAPQAVHAEPEGGRSFEYSRQPAGQTCVMVTLGADGVVRAAQQVLAPEQFARVRPGMGRDELRRLLGRPAKVWEFPRKRETVWDWRWRDGGHNQVFSATFDPDGRLLHAGSGIDPSDMEGGG